MAKMFFLGYRDLEFDGKSATKCEMCVEAVLVYWRPRVLAKLSCLAVSISSFQNRMIRCKQRYPVLGNRIFVTIIHEFYLPTQISLST